MGLLKSIINRVLFRVYPTYIIEKSSLFDSEWYSNTYRIEKKKAAKNYLIDGYKNGCDPSVYFSSFNYYLANPDTKVMNPLLHYEIWGREENRMTTVDGRQKNSIFNIQKEDSQYIKAYNKKNREIRKCAIFASYCKDETIPEYVVYYLKELSKIVDAIIFIADNGLKDHQEINKIIDYVEFAQFGKHNTFDFGSYKIGFEYLKSNNLLNNIDELYMTNDSCYGPVNGFENIINVMSMKECDFWGLLDSRDRDNYHLLSFFYCFKNNVINDIRFYNFFNRVKYNMSWEYTVNNLETKFTEYLSEFYKSEAYIKDFCDNSFKVIAGNMNPTLWPVELLGRDFPLIKIKCLDGRFGNEMHSNAGEVLKIVKDKNRILYEIIKKDLQRRGCKLDEINCFDLINTAKVISFDIFDTLLIRPFAVPVDLFNYISKKYKEERFSSIRIMAEKRARRVYDKEEINIDDIYSQMPAAYQKYKEIELNEELSLCSANPIVANLYKYALENSKIIVATSDMYFNEDFLQKLLEKNGYDKIAKIFVSSEYKHTKGSGKLFKDVLNSYSIKPNELLHIGDNEISDISIAKEIGIKTHKVDKIFNHFLDLQSMYKYSKCWNDNYNYELSVHFSILANRYCKTSDRTYFEEFGYALGGPLVLGYLFFISENIAANDIDQVMFVARDGYQLQILYNKYFNSKKIQTDYVYLTRAVVLSSTLNYNDEPSYIKSILLLAHKDNKNINVFNDKASNLKEFNRHLSYLTRWSKKKEVVFKKYMINIARKNKSIAIVDTTTKNFTSLYGAFYALKDRVKLGLFTGSFDDRSVLPFNTFSKRYFTINDVKAINISEILMSSPEPMIEGIDEYGTPMFANQNIKDRKERYDQILKGIDNYINDYISLFGKDKTSTMSLETWIVLCNYFINYQNPIDKKELGKIEFNESAVSEQSKINI